MMYTNMLKKIYNFRLDLPARTAIYLESYRHYFHNHNLKPMVGVRTKELVYSFNVFGKKLILGKYVKLRKIIRYQTPAFWFYNFSTFVPASLD